ncbi:MAG: DHH family phosphoesterase [Clostridia bacterium]|nr:DHH family phosphoesterase [Clostridia bacterium]
MKSGAFFAKLKKILRKEATQRIIGVIVISLAFIWAIHAIYSSPTLKIPPKIAFPLSFIIYLLSEILFILVLRFIHSKFLSRPDSPLFSAEFFSSMTNSISAPIALITSKGYILWINSAFSAMRRHASIHSRQFSSYGNVSVDALLDAHSDGVKCEVGGIPYTVSGRSFYIGKARIISVIWTDNSELEEVRKTMHEEEMLVAYIVVDNLDELVQVEQENTNAAAAEISSVLTAWATSVNGSIKEYERNRYIFFFAAKHMATFTAQKFDILEKIRAIKIGTSGTPITISIGTTTLGDNILAKENSARACLEMALARGGDQAVVKTAEGIEYYGGVTKTMQKRSTVKSRSIALSLANLISQSSNVIIFGHRFPDYDCFGASIGVARFCMHCGIPCNIVVDTEDKNLSKGFTKIKGAPAYNHIFVDLTAGQNLLRSDTLVIIVDVNNPKQFYAPAIAEAAENIVYLDHHRQTDAFPKDPLLSYIEPSASSTCEIIAELLEQVLPSGRLTKIEADFLYSGIILDTKYFAQNIGVRTFAAALYLRSEGADPVEVQELFKVNLDDMQREAKFKSNIHIYRKVVAIASNLDENNTPADRIAAAKVADSLLSIDNVLASFAICRIDNSICISARSSGTINVQLILERLNGGGHYNAAATQMPDITIEEALVKLKDSIDIALDGENQTK